MQDPRPDTPAPFSRAGRVIPYFQPIMNVRTGMCCGAEVLARIQPPGGHILLPSQFIHPDTPDETLTLLTQTLMKRVREALVSFQFPSPFMLTFNIVPETLSAPWLLQACHTLAEKNITVTLELTEQRPLNGDITRLRASLSRLQDAGVKLAIDDFGTGHAGLSMLMNSGGDYIKIPREFVVACGENPRAGGVINTILHLAGIMNMNVIAEGVDSRARVEQLFAMGTDLFQGAFFSMPLCFSDFIAYYRRVSSGGGVAYTGSGLSLPLLRYCAGLHGLSPRETEVIIRTVQGEGFFSGDVAGEARSAKTRSSRKRSAYRKMGVNSDVGLLHYLYWLNERCRAEGALSARGKVLTTPPAEGGPASAAFFPSRAEKAPCGMPVAKEVMP